MYKKIRKQAAMPTVRPMMLIKEKTLCRHRFLKAIFK
jgi:hypothetical protein